MDANKALKIFFDEARKITGNKLPMTFEQFLSDLSSSSDRKFQLIVPTINEIIDMMEKDSWFRDIDSRIEDAMRSLVYKSRSEIANGMIPNVSAFTQAIAGQFTDLKFSDYAHITKKAVSKSVDNLATELKWWRSGYKVALIGLIGVSAFVAYTRLNTINKMAKRKR